MKKYLTILIISLISEFSYSQAFLNKSMYLKAGLSKGPYWGGRLSLEFISERKVSYSFNFDDQSRISRRLPADFSTNNFFSVLIFGQDYPLDLLRLYSLTVGKVYVNEYNDIRINLKAGIGYVNLTYPTNFVKSSFELPSVENYSYDFERNHSFCFILDPSIDFNLRKYFGLSFGLTTIMYHNNLTITGHFSILLGIVNRNE